MLFFVDIYVWFKSVSTTDFKDPLQARKAHWNLSEWVFWYIGKKSDQVPDYVTLKFVKGAPTN